MQCWTDWGGLAGDPQVWLLLLLWKPQKTLLQQERAAGMMCITGAPIATILEQV